MSWSSSHVRISIQSLFGVAAAGHEWCGGTAAKEFDTLHTSKNGHVNTFKLARVLPTAIHFCCHDSLHEARSGVKGWGWQAKDGGSKKSGLDNMRWKRFTAKFMKSVELNIISGSLCARHGAREMGCAARGLNSLLAKMLLIFIVEHPVSSDHWIPEITVQSMCCCVRC